jgi:predicted membrane-bound mannosyltransferase
VTQSPISNLKSQITNVLLVILLLVAAFLRLYRLDEIPPGVTHDEADTGYFVEVVYRTGRCSQVETPYGYAYKPFTQYSAVPFMALFGANDLALRFHAAFWGLVLVLFTYLWARRAFGVTVGLGSAAMVAVTFWTVFDSRFALNSPPCPALFTGAMYFLWLALDD